MALPFEPDVLSFDVRDGEVDGDRSVGGARGQSSSAPLCVADRGAYLERNLLLSRFLTSSESVMTNTCHGASPFFGTSCSRIGRATTSGPSNVSTAHGTRHAERSRRRLTWGGVVAGGVEEVAGASEEVRNVALAVALRVGPRHAAAAHAQLHPEREAAAVHALGVGRDDRPNRRHGPEQEVDEAPVELGGPLLQLLGEICLLVTRHHSVTHQNQIEMIFVWEIAKTFGRCLRYRGHVGEGPGIDAKVLHDLLPVARVAADGVDVPVVGAPHDHLLVVEHLLLDVHLRQGLALPHRRVLPTAHHNT